MIGARIRPDRFDRESKKKNEQQQTPGPATAGIFLPGIFQAKDNSEPDPHA
jgi:hypothetical protein